MICYSLLGEVKLKSLSINYRIFLYILYTFLILPDVIQDMSVVHYIVLVFKALAGCIAFYFFFVMRKRSKALNSLCFYILFIGFITFINAFSLNNVARYMAKYGAIFILAVFSEYLLTRDSLNFVKFLRNVLGIGFLINLVSVFILPEGLGTELTETGRLMTVYFYDYDNHFIIRYIPTIAVFYVYGKHISKRRYGGIETLIVIILSFLSLLFLRSVASFVSCFVIVVGYIFINNIPKTILNPKFIWLGYLIMSVLLIAGAGILLATGLMTDLGKSVSLIVRLRMWILAVKAIPNHLLFGTGVLDSITMRASFLYAQLHNSMLTILLWSGTIGLVLYSRFIFNLNLTIDNDKLIEDKKFLSVLLIATMIVSLLDGVELLLSIYLFYMLVANYDCVITNLGKKASIT